MMHSLQPPALRDWIGVLCLAGLMVTFPLPAETVTNGPTARQIDPAPANLMPPPMPAGNVTGGFIPRTAGHDAHRTGTRVDEPAAGHPRPDYRQGARVRSP